MDPLKSPEGPSPQKNKYVVPGLVSVAAIGVGILAAQLALRDGKAPVGASAPVASTAGEPAATAPVAETPQLPLPPEASLFVELAKRVVPSVVNISTVSEVKGRPGQFSYDLFHRFFEDFFRGQEGEPEGDEEGGPPSMPRPPKTMALGSGFVFESSGLILTNNHVVADADEILIHFTESDDEQPSQGKVVGRDLELDLALVRADTNRAVQPLPLGDSDRLQVGEYVAAVGNPFGRGHSVSHGIVSALDRKAPGLLARYLQTDAPINPGNSGGPLVNLRGEVVAINNAIDARAQGIGFAIPINLVKKVLPQLQEKGTVERGYIGVLVDELTPEVAEQIGAPSDLRAPFVSHVYSGEPAAKAGIKVYDVILSFNGKPIGNGEQLVDGVTSTSVGQTVQVKILRGGKEQEVAVLIGQRPSGNEMAKSGKEKKPRKRGAPRKVDPGMELESLTPETAVELGLPADSKGVVVESVGYGGAAEKAGLARGDVIVEVDRKEVTTQDEFYGRVTERKRYLLRVRTLDEDGRDVFRVTVLDLSDAPKGG